MRMRPTVLSVVVALIASVSLHAQTRAGGNIAAAPPTGAVPRLADGTPDLSGVWLFGGPRNDIATALPQGETLPLLPETRSRMASQKAADDPQANCLPIPPPRTSPYPWRMVTTPTHVFFLYEMYSYRQVFMDGRKHPPADELYPTWYGHSIGWWEGDTLVVDTVGMNDKTWFDNRGNRHSDKLHMITRYTRTDLGHMTVDYTIDDPGAYARPFTLHSEALLMPGDELIEYVCNENNQDVPYLDGAKR